MTWRNSRLVRVRWKNRRTLRVRSFVAGVLAHDERDAAEIADCIVGCMVPVNLPLNIAYETAVLDREARVADGHAEATVWERFDAYQVGQVETKRLGRK
jgi:hypothetical protein